MRPSEYLASLDSRRSVIFDLDNTIYDEHTFLFDGYRRVAQYVAARTGVDALDAYKFLRWTYLSEGRIGLLDKFIERFSLDSAITLDTMLAKLRDLTGVRLSCFFYCREYFQAVNRAFVITNGNLVQQRAKCISLDLLSLNKNLVIVYAAEYKPKPAAAAYDWLSGHYDIVDPVYLGDDDLDADFARRCGMEFARISFKRDPRGMAVEDTLYAS